MKFRTNRKHIIDFIFPVVLFVVFALCALTVLLLAARIYQSTTETSSLNYTSRTGLSYINEKIHQNDVNGGVSIRDLNGTPALVMEQTYDTAVYYTYIYSYDGELKELFVKSDTPAELSSGKTILEVKSFSMEEAGENLLRFECVRHIYCRRPSCIIPQKRCGFTIK